MTSIFLWEKIIKGLRGKVCFLLELISWWRRKNANGEKSKFMQINPFLICDRHLCKCSRTQQVDVKLRRKKVKSQRHHSISMKRARARCQSVRPARAMSTCCRATAARAAWYINVICMMHFEFIGTAEWKKNSSLGRTSCRWVERLVKFITSNSAGAEKSLMELYANEGFIY